MIRIMRSAKSVLSKRDLNYLGIINSTDVDIFKSPEENLSNIIKNYVFSDNLQHLSDINAIYKLLMKIKNFREFILLNDLGMNLSFNMLKEGILQPYKKDEIIYKKDTYPKYYFLVLVGNISYLNNLQTLINPGCFFGDEIIQRIRYKQTAISSSDKTILLLIPKTFIISNIIDKIILANERIQKCIENSFQVFKTLDSTTFVKNYEKMIKIFPYMDDIIISTKDVANAIFIIYNGICTLNNDKKGDLIILEKGDIIGSESLANIDENGNIMNYTYLYNLINKAHNTIILKFFINEFHPTIINALQLQLSSYFLQREEIIQKNEENRQTNKNRLIKNYTIFKKKDNMNERISKSIIREFTPEKAEISFNMALNQIKSNNKFHNDKQKLTLRKNYVHKGKINKIFLFNKSSGDKSHINFKDIKTIKRRKFDSLSNLIKIGKIKKKMIFPDYKKSIEQKENKKVEINILKHKFKLKRKDSDSSINNKKSLENSNNDSFFFTAVDVPNKIYKKIEILGQSKESLLFTNRLRKKRLIKDSLQNKMISLLASPYKDSFSFRNGNQLMSAKKQIEIYGCTALDTINYFNYGYKERSLMNDKGQNNKRCLFYKTLKFNLPLVIFCDRKSKDII